MECYSIENNYSLCFRVIVYNENSLTVLKSVFDNEKFMKNKGKDPDKYHNTFPCIHIQKCERIFLGKNVDCENSRFSGSAGDDYIGNSILIELRDRVYMCIFNRDIVTFKTKSKITKFYSIVGNNDVTYPYAIDEDNKYYTFCPEEILTFKGKKWVKDPNYLEDFESRETFKMKKIKIPEKFTSIVEYL